jgi:outer membrane lipoprotein SlyB
MNPTKAVAASLALVTVLTGCAAPGFDGGAYTREQARREQTVRMGHVESVREVQQVVGTRSGVAAGAGAIGGGIAGQAAEQGLTAKRAVEVTVKLDNGQMVAIVQGVDATFRPGERVRILSDGATSRVTR